MTATAVCRVVGGVLVVLIGAAVGLGGLQLWRGGAKAWPDVVADEIVVGRTAAGMMAMGVMLLFAGTAAIANAPWGCHAAAIATTVFVAAAFWANYALFGDIRPLHTGTNVVVAAIILALLWYGNGGEPALDR